MRVTDATNAALRADAVDVERKNVPIFRGLNLKNGVGVDEPGGASPREFFY